MAVSIKPKLRVALFSQDQDKASETFIKAHMERLPFHVLPRYGKRLCIRYPDNRSVWFWGSWFAAASRKVAPGLIPAALEFFMARHLRTIKADAVLAEYGTNGSYLAPACARAGIPLFVHFHGYDASVTALLEAYRKPYQQMFNIATGIVAVSKPMQEKLLNLGARAEQLFLNPCGVDPALFEGGNPQEKPAHFVGVGRFIEKKAPYLTVLAFSEAVKEVPDATLTLAGDGPLLGPCKHMAEALGLQHSVSFPGHIDHDQVRRLLRKARAFVQHSIVAESGDSEGTPVSVIEAQMAGLPVVATRHAGIPEVVVDGNTGYTVAERDIKAMADRICRLAKDKALAGRMGAAAREHARRHFSIDRHINELAAMIEAGVVDYSKTRHVQ